MNLLIIAPHADDEVVSCGGMIAKMSDAGHNVDVIVVAMGWTPIVERMLEFRKASEVLGVRHNTVWYMDKESYLDIVPQHQLVRKLDDLLDNYIYDEIYYPCPAQHHHDHRAVEEACRAALRPGAHRPGPSLVATYEHTFPGWSPNPYTSGRMYVDITDYLDRKCEAWLCYRSQVEKNGPNHPVSVKGIRALAAMRGIEAGCESAELYNIVQLRR